MDMRDVVSHTHTTFRLGASRPETSIEMTIVALGYTEPQFGETTTRRSFSHISYSTRILLVRAARILSVAFGVLKKLGSSGDDEFPRVALL